MNRLIGPKALGIAALVCCFLIPAASFAADVDVYAEGAYTDNDLVLYIYADINAGPILSFGVKVEYPTGLTYSSATKNEAVWHFKDGATNYSYMNPEDDGTGVVIIGGKLDTADPTAGVDGNRVLLGTVTFTRNGPTDFSAVTLTYGRGDGAGEYKNFVATDGAVKDGAGVDMTNITIAQRGDANLDDRINTQDMSKIRSVISNGGIPHPWIDCTGDGRINTQDMSCVRGIITN